MKKLLVATMLTLASANLMAQATTSEVKVIKSSHSLNVYEAICKINAPLDTWDRCDENSYLGQLAIACAMEAAMDKCGDGPNVDCVESSESAYPVISQEFPGFKMCVAKARVHGYSVNN